MSFVSRLLAMLSGRALQEQMLVLLSVAILALLALVAVFAGATLVFRLRNDRVARRWARLEAKWEDTVLDVIAGDAEPQALLRRVGERDALRFVEFLSRFARRVRGPETQRLARLAAPFLEIIARRSGHRHPAVRARSIQTLALLGFEHYAQRIVGALTDPSDMVAMAAAHALATREHPEYAGAVLARLHRFTLWDRQYLCRMVGGMGPGATEALIATLANERETPRVRSVAADALRKLNAIGAADLAAEIAGRSDDRNLLCATIRLLGRLGRPEHIALVRRHTGAEDEIVRAQAVGALAQLESPAALTGLAPLLDDPSLWVAREAARALRQVGRGRFLEDVAAADHPRADLIRQVLGEPAA